MVTYSLLKSSRKKQKGQILIEFVIFMILFTGCFFALLQNETSLSETITKNQFQGSFKNESSR